MKKCTKCGEKKVFTEFRKDKTKKDGYYPSCKDCHRERLGSKKMGTFISHRKTHGMTETRFYKIYRAILDRCNYPSNVAYSRYGGRGIKCYWETFEDFKNDMYDSYLEHEKIHGTKQTTIDRRKNNLGYYKKNCRWATYKVQNKNRNLILKKCKNILKI